MKTNHNIETIVSEIIVNGSAWMPCEIVEAVRHGLKDYGFIAMGGAISDDAKSRVLYI